MKKLMAQITLIMIIEKLIPKSPFLENDDIKLKVRGRLLRAMRGILENVNKNNILAQNVNFGRKAYDFLFNSEKTNCNNCYKKVQKSKKYLLNYFRVFKPQVSNFDSFFQKSYPNRKNQKNQKSHYTG